MATFEITRVEDETREWEAKKGPAAGKKFTAYTVEAKDEKGQVKRYEISRLPTSPPPELGPGEYTVEESSNPNFLPKLKKVSAGNFRAPSYQRDNGDERSRRIERQHSQEMAIRWVALAQASEKAADSVTLEDLRSTIDWFQQDLDADVGGEERPSHSPAADVNAVAIGGLEPQTTTTTAQFEEASSAQKRRLTNEFKKVGLVPEVMKAVVMVRCRSEKATKDGASSLIQDLVDGATAESLLAEVYDAKRAGDPVGIRAAKLIPENSPVDTEGLPELDAEGKQILGIKDESDVPF